MNAKSCARRWGSFSCRNRGDVSIGLLTWQLQSWDWSSRAVRFVRHAPKVFMQNEGDFVDIILLNSRTLFVQIAHTLICMCAPPVLSEYHIFSSQRLLPHVSVASAEERIHQLSQLLRVPKCYLWRAKWNSPRHTPWRHRRRYRYTVRSIHSYPWR